MARQALAYIVVNPLVGSLVCFRAFAVMRLPFFLQQRVFVHPGDAVVLGSRAIRRGSEDTTLIRASTDGAKIVGISLIRPHGVHPALPMLTIPLLEVPFFVSHRIQLL